MNWYFVEKSYIQYLRKFDSKVGYIDYGSRLKLYLGIILSVGDFFYYVPISSAKAKHKNMKNSLDFQKVQDENTLYAVLNLNNMIPVPNNCIQQIKYNKIEKLRSFDSETERTDYIYLLPEMRRESPLLREHALLRKPRKLWG